MSSTNNSGSGGQASAFTIGDDDEYERQFRQSLAAAAEIVNMEDGMVGADGSDRQFADNGHSLPTTEQLRNDMAMTSALVRDSRDGITVDDGASTDDKSVHKRVEAMRRRVVIYMCLACLVLAAVISFSVGFSMRNDEGNDPAASSSMGNDVGSGEDSGSPGVPTVPDAPDQPDLEPKDREDDDRHPHQDLEPVPRARQVEDFLKSYSKEEDLVTVGTPQYLASKWITEESAQMPVPESTDYDVAFPFVQRYIMAVFYYALGGPEWDQAHKDSMGYMSGQHVCDWNFALQSQEPAPGTDKTDWIMGILCNKSKEVDYIFMPGVGLKGEIPHEVGLLMAMSHFSAFSNEISGELPNSFKFLSEIRFLSMESNDLSGQIPEWFGQNLTRLEYVALGNNNLSGPLPSSMSDLKQLKQIALESNDLEGNVNVFNGATNLESLFLQDNFLTGNIDSSLFADLNKLKVLDMANNKLEGGFPQHFYQYEVLALHNNSITGNLPPVMYSDYPLRFLSLYDNDIAGPMPIDLGVLNELEHLDMSNNNIEGPIPDSLNSMESLRVLYLGNNDFDEGGFPTIWELSNLEEITLDNTNRVGPIPDWVGTSLKKLVLLDLHDNDMNGTIPETMGQMGKLSFLLLNRNDFSDVIPESFRSLSKLVLLMVDNNDITGGLDGVCNSTSGPPSLDYVVADCDVACPCCDFCCNANDDTCNNGYMTSHIHHGYERDQYVFSEDLIFRLSP